jgi:hypothetical protein
MNFAFAAADAIVDAEQSQIEVRALDPDKDRARLENLVADPAVFRALSGRCGKFALPEGLVLGEGIESVVLPRPAMVLKPKSKSLRSLPRMGQLGPLPNRIAQRLLKPGTRLTDASKGLALKLVPGEMRQIIVHVAPRKGNVFHAVDVNHVGPNCRPIGGLTVIFVPPPDFY